MGAPRTRLVVALLAVTLVTLSGAGVASADYSAGHWAPGIMRCTHVSNGYKIGTTQPVMVPDVPNQLEWFKDELWNNAGGKWHVVVTSPWAARRAPPNIFVDATAQSFVYNYW